VKGCFGVFGLALLALSAHAAEPIKPIELATADGKLVLRFKEKPQERIELEAVMSTGHKCTRSTFQFWPEQGAAMYALVLDCPTYDDFRPEYLAMHDVIEGFVRQISPTETAPVTHEDLEANGYKVREFRHVRQRGEVRARCYVFKHSSIALLTMWKFDDPVAARDAVAFLDPL